MLAIYNGLGKAVHYKIESCDTLDDIAAVTHFTKDELVSLLQDVVDIDQKEHFKEDE